MLDKSNILALVGGGEYPKFSINKITIWENGFKKKSLESNETLQSYAKWMNKNFNKLFLAKPQNVLDFLADICNFNSEIAKKTIKI